MKVDDKAIDLIAAGEEVLLDMDNIDKELLPDEESFFVLLRNLDADPTKVKLSFSKLSYDTKAAWLEAYAKTKLLVEVKELAIAWADVAHACLSQQVDDVESSYFTHEELRKFLFNNMQLCQAVVQLLHDTMYWAVSVVSKQQYEFNGESELALSPSILFSCKYVSCFDIALQAAFKTCKAWPGIFVQQHFAQAKQLLMTSKVCVLMYGKTTPQWELLKQLLNQTFC